MKLQSLKVKYLVQFNIPFIYMLRFITFRFSTHGCVNISKLNNNEACSQALELSHLDC